MRRTLPSYGLLAVMLCLTAALAYEAKHTGLTVDESSHFAAGYMYCLGADVLQPADTPPLTRMFSGWVARVLGAADPRKSKYFDSRDAYLIGAEILDAVGKRSRRLLFYSRLPFLVFPLGIVFLLWHWGRQLFDEPTALILALCGALEPTVLGHGALIDSDVPAAFSALWFAYAAWNYWRIPTVRRLLFLAVVLLIAVLIKFTLLPLVFIGYALALWRGPRLLAAVAIPLVIYAGILVTGQFQAQPVSLQYVSAIAGPSIPEWLVTFASIPARLPWPTQFVSGIAYIAGNLHSDGFDGYMLGHRIHGWTPGYFPLAWAVKFPIPLQILSMAGMAACLIRIVKRRAGAAEAIISSGALLFIILAVSSNFHIGFRHLLPALPLLILGGGYALEPCLANGWGRIAIAAGIVWLGVSSMSVYPHGLAYFNEWIGGPKNGWKYLADSNVDWGQNYPDLADYLKRNNIKSTKAFLFGFDNPWLYMYEQSLSPLPLPLEGTKPGQRYQPTPGTYAISVNLLTGLMLPAGHEDYLAEFRNRTPDAYAGYSILIYSVN